MLRGKLQTGSFKKRRGYQGVQALRLQAKFTISFLTTTHSISFLKPIRKDSVQVNCRLGLNSNLSLKDLRTSFLNFLMSTSYLRTLTGNGSAKRRHSSSRPSSRSRRSPLGLGQKYPDRRPSLLGRVQDALRLASETWEVRYQPSPRVSFGTRRPDTISTS